MKLEFDNKETDDHDSVIGVKFVNVSSTSITITVAKAYAGRFTRFLLSIQAKHNVNPCGDEVDIVFTLPSNWSMLI